MGKRGPKPKPVESRFWSKVYKRSPSECWIWIGPVRRGGYGAMEIEGKMVSAHRLAYEMHFGPIPDGFYIDHICRVQKCVNPSHLRPATPAENGYNRGRNSNSSSGLKGVSWEPSRMKWRATIQANGKSTIVGRYETAELAHAAYCEAAKRLHGDFACPTD